MNIKMLTGREVVSPFSEMEKVTASDEKDPSFDTDPSFVATAFSDTQANVCPKCFQAMGRAQLSDGENVYYCPTCRVTHPMPD